MTERISKLRAGDFLRSRILFRANMIRANTPEIPIGVVSELVVDDCRVFGIAVRQELTSPEISWLPETWRPELSQPFNYWFKEFQTAWGNSNPGKAIHFLSDRHSSSMIVLSPTSMKLPASVHKDKDVDSLIAAVGELTMVLVADADAFLKPSPTVMEIEKLKLAA